MTAIAVPMIIWKEEERRDGHMAEKVVPIGDLHTSPINPPVPLSESRELVIAHRNMAFC